jgi:lysophospholipase L1-like esterase
MGEMKAKTLALFAVALLGSCAALSAWKMLAFHERLAALENPRWEQTLSAEHIYKRPIVLFGDSEISLWPISTSFGVLPVLNRGLGGDWAMRAEQRFREQVLSLDAAAVVLLIGTNDIAHGRTTQEVLMTIGRMVSAAQEKGQKVILCSVLPARGEAARVRPSIQLMNAGLRALAHEHNAVFVDLYAAVLDRRGVFSQEFSDDGLHPNAAGYVRMTAVLMPYVVAELGVSSQDKAGMVQLGSLDGIR